VARTLVVNAQPNAPVPLSTLIAAGVAAPQTIPDLFGLRIGVE